MKTPRFDYGRRFREIEHHMIDDALARWEKPADARGATPPSNGLRTADVSGEARSSNGSDHQHSPALIGSPPTAFDRLQREHGLAKLNNEVLRDLLEVAWTTITTLAPTGENRAADGLRGRIWAHLHDEEASCAICDHYVVNHEATGPCACFECPCQGNE